MTARCGIDIVEMKRFKRLIERSGAEQMQRIFTLAEWEYCQSKRYPNQSLAARFAAKEACLKLFPAETNRKELDFIDIEIIMDNDGAPSVQLSDKLQAILQRYELTQISVSISHTTQYACGIAITD